MDFSRLALVAAPPCGDLQSRSTFGKPSHAFVSIWAEVLCRFGFGECGSGWASRQASQAEPSLHRYYSLELSSFTTLNDNDYFEQKAYSKNFQDIFLFIKIDLVQLQILIIEISNTLFLITTVTLTT